jgi:outer membrane protein TolC
MNGRGSGIGNRALSLALLAALAAVSPAGAQQGEPLSFPQALERMRSAHETLRAAGQEAEQRREEREARKGLHWPKVELAGQFTRIDEPIEIDLDPIRRVILTLHPQVPASRVPPFVETVQGESFWKADVRATWPIYTGGKIAAANRAAEARVAEAVHQRRQAEQSLSSELVRRYFAVRLASAAQGVREAVLAGLDRHLYEARRLEEEGLISRAERLHAEVARGEADRQVKRAGHDLAIARAALANILSQASAGEPSSPLFVTARLGPLEEFQAAASRDHPAFARLAAQRDVASQAVAAERARWRPDVYLFAKRELHEDGLTLLDPAWAGGVGATVTLFDGFARKHDAAAARLQLARVETLEGRARRDVDTLVEKRYHEVERGREQFEALAAALDLAAENLRVRTRAFEEGLATSLEVVDARLALSRAQLERLASAYEFDVALADLLEASGQADRFEALRQQGKPVGAAMMEQQP